MCKTIVTIVVIRLDELLYELLTVVVVCLFNSVLSKIYGCSRNRTRMIRYKSQSAIGQCSSEIDWFVAESESPINDLRSRAQSYTDRFGSPSKQMSKNLLYVWMSSHAHSILQLNNHLYQCVNVWKSSVSFTWIDCLKTTLCCAFNCHSKIDSHSNKWNK